MAWYAGGEEANTIPLLTEEIFGSYTLIRLRSSFFFYLYIVLEGNIEEANERIKRGVPVGRVPVVTLRNQDASYVVTWFVQVSPTFLFIQAN
jgi:cytochrome oxidase assembly protein ShyY1